MIINGSLSPEQQAASQRNYYKFCLLNGFSYMCVGETMMILLAVQLGVPNWVIAAMGAMIYVGFLLLPLGKILTAHYGAALTQGIAWICRNIAGCLIAAATVAEYFQCHNLAIVMILVGSFTFYGFRAAGVIMSQPLVAGISNASTQAVVCAKGNAYFYVMALPSLGLIYCILGWRSNGWVLSALMLLGAVLGASCFNFLRNMDEPETLQMSSRKPILPQMLKLLKQENIRQQMLMTFAMNSAIAMVVPVSMLALKRGFGVDDHRAMLLSSFQFGGAAAASYLTGKLSNLIGPRRVLMTFYAVLVLLCLGWFMAPDTPLTLFCMAVFSFCGVCRAALEVAQAHYFMRNTDRNDQVAGSILISVCGAFFAGLFAVAADAVLLRWMVTADDIEHFRCFYLATALVILPGFYLIWRIRPLEKERRFMRLHFRAPH